MHTNHANSPCFPEREPVPVRRGTLWNRFHRVGVLLVVLVAGCGKPAAVPEGKESAAVPVDLPKPVGKIDASDLMSHYTRIGFNHKWDGQNIELRISNDAWLMPDGKGAPCIVYDTDKGYRRPALIARIPGTWKKGAKPTSLPTVKLQGKLVGLVDYKAYPEFKDWSVLVPGHYAPAFDRVALLENAAVIDD